MATAHDDDYAPEFFSSLPIIDGLVSAIEAAVNGGDSMLAAYLAFQLSRLLLKFHWIPYAIHFDDLATDVLEALPPSDLQPLREFRLMVYRQAALDHLLLGHLTVAAERFAMALGLLTDEMSPDVRASLQWDSSVLEQWRNNPAAGLKLALGALEYYRSCDQPNEVCRLYLHIADLMMDVLTKDSPQGLCDPTLQNQAYLNRVRAQLAAALPAPGTGFASEIEITYALVSVRLSRLEDRPGDRIGLIELAMKQAAGLHSKLGIAQALTAMGDELLAEGDFEKARQHYREAIEVFNDSLAPGLALMPRRRLSRLEEFLAIQAPPRHDEAEDEEVH